MRSVVLTWERGRLARSGRDGRVPRRVERDEMTELSERQGKSAPPPLYEVIYRTLREHLAERRFPEGLIIGEAAVARAFQSSRIPAGVALRRLQDDGLLQNFDGRGFLAAREVGAAPVRLGLAEAGLRLPEALRSDLDIRNQRKRIYARIEHQIACCLPYGRFQLNESVLATAYGVSRTVAHEVLARLERSGLVTQDLNRRWYAGPLTRESMREHYEMRWLLEPVALSQSMSVLARQDLIAKRDRLRRVRNVRLTARIVEGVEQDLHVDVVLKCQNQQLRDAIRRSQLPLIATHDSFKRYRDAREMRTLLDEHETVFQHLIEGRLNEAMAALENHLRRSVAPSMELMSRFVSLPAARRVPFLTKIE
jgi:DNA-binding GntR family transcriptional regulator